MPPHGIFQLFVYGSLRSGFRSPAYEYMSRYFRLVGDARVRGRLFDMGEYSAGVPADGDSFIVGELYQIIHENEFSYAIGQLDDYEGITMEHGENPLYCREQVDVEINGSTTRAWIYWFKGDTTGRPVIESGDLMQYMQEKK